VVSGGATANATSAAVTTISHVAVASTVVIAVIAVVVAVGTVVVASVMAVAIWSGSRKSRIVPGAVLRRFI
jgi:hypothetical protein